MGMIDDEELVALFKAESQERLQRLDEKLLELEASPDNLPVLEELLREAHNLKGAARMLGAEAIGTVAHHFEEILSATRKTRTPLSQEAIDRLCEGLQALRALVTEVLTGEAAGIDLQVVIARLSGEAPGLEAGSGKREAGGENTGIQRASDGEAGGEAEETALAVPPDAPGLAPAVLAGALVPTPAEPLETSVASALEEAPAQVSDSGFRIDTIRVETGKLDSLMTHAGELAVTRIRIARRLIDIDELAALWEEWTRDAGQGMRDVRSGKRENGKAARLLSYHERERERLERLGALIEHLRRDVQEDNTRLDFIADQLEESIRGMRLLPLSTIFNLFPRMVRDMARDQAKAIDLAIEGKETCADKRIIEDMKDPLMHVIRNAVDHGIETPEERERAGKPRTGQLRLRAYQTATSIVIEIADDGRGLDLEGIKRTAIRRGVCREEELRAMSASEIYALIFRPGFSTRSIVTDISGRGVGLDVVLKNVERLKGTLQMDSTPGQGCAFRVQLPITLATSRVLIAAVGNEVYALPVELVETTRLISPAELFSIRGSRTALVEGRPVSVVRLADLLERPGPGESSARSDGAGRPDRPLACVILAIGEDRLGLLVDALLDESEVVLKPLGALLSRVRNIAGATILGTGQVCMVLNPHDLLKSVRRRAISVLPEPGMLEPERKKTILLVEDSITTRTQEKRILEGAGYEVVTAVDGVDGWNKLTSRAFDALISDIEMPNLDGLALAEKIRREERYRDLPLILVTSLASEEHRKRGAEAGADAYITKSSFDQGVLLETLRRLV
jgi:two-component system, chemotaxis family, sensor kinase CheA